MFVILPWPLATSAELAWVLRPGGHLRPDSALRSLRDRGVGARPVAVVPRSGRRAHGRVVYYSSLMIDVARLVRLEEQDSAVAVHAQADRLARHRAAQFIADWLVERGGAEPDLGQLDLDTGGALTRLATLTSSARSKLQPRLHVDSVVGRVADVTEFTAVIVDDIGERCPIPVPAPDLRGDGTPVAIDYELFGESAIAVWARPAFDADADPNEHVVGGPHILTPAERERLGRYTASAR